MSGIETHIEALCGELRKSVNQRVVVANDDRSTGQETLNNFPVTRVTTWPIRGFDRGRLNLRVLTAHPQEL
jgi:hypothetical protein